MFIRLCNCSGHQQRSSEYKLLGLSWGAQLRQCHAQVHKRTKEIDAWNAAQGKAKVQATSSALSVVWIIPGSS